MEPDDPIRELLDRVRARWHALRAFQAAVRASLAASAVLIVALLVVRGLAQWAGRPPLVPAILAAATLLLAVGAVAWAFAPLRHRPSDARVARFIEERAPALDDRLVSAVDVINGPPRTETPCCGRRCSPMRRHAPAGSTSTRFFRPRRSGDPGFKRPPRCSS